MYIVSLPRKAVYICSEFVSLKTAKIPKSCERQIPEANYSRIAFLLILSYNIPYCVYQQYTYDTKYVISAHILAIGVWCIKAPPAIFFNEIIIFFLFQNQPEETVHEAGLLVQQDNIPAEDKPSCKETIVE